MLAGFEFAGLFQHAINLIDFGNFLNLEFIDLFDRCIDICLVPWQFDWLSIRLPSIIVRGGCRWLLVVVVVVVGVVVGGGQFKLVFGSISITISITIAIRFDLMMCIFEVH